MTQPEALMRREVLNRRQMMAATGMTFGGGLLATRPVTANEQSDHYVDEANFIEVLIEATDTSVSGRLMDGVDMSTIVDSSNGRLAVNVNHAPFRQYDTVVKSHHDRYLSTGSEIRVETPQLILNDSFEDSHRESIPTTSVPDFPALSVKEADENSAKVSIDNTNYTIDEGDTWYKTFQEETVTLQGRKARITFSPKIKIKHNGTLSIYTTDSGVLLPKGTNKRWVQREIERHRRANNRKQDAAPIKESRNFVAVEYGTPPS